MSSRAMMITLEACEKVFANVKVNDNEDEVKSGRNGLNRAHGKNCGRRDDLSKTSLVFLLQKQPRRQNWR